MGNLNVRRDIDLPSLDFDNDGNSDFYYWEECLIFKEGIGLIKGDIYKDTCDKTFGGIKIFINNKWVQLVEFTPMWFYIIGISSSVSSNFQYTLPRLQATNEVSENLPSFIQ